MIRRDIDRIDSWTDAELAATYNDLLNADRWREQDWKMVNAVKAEMSRRNPSPKVETRRHERVTKDAPIVQAVNDTPKQQTFEEMYKDLRQK